MPTILHAAGFQSPYGGNFIAALTCLRAACGRRNWRMLLAVPEDARQRDWCARLGADGWGMHFLPARFSYARCAAALAKIVAREDCGIIHSHFIMYDITSWLAALAVRLRGRRVRLVWHAHSEVPRPEGLLRRLKTRIKYRWIGRCARMIPVADAVRQQLLAVGVRDSQVHTIINGIDFARATAATANRLQVLSSLGIAADRELLLLLGWAPVRKGVDTAIDAVRELIHQGCPLVLGLVGREELEQYVAVRTDNQPPDWLRIIPPVENVANLYRAATIFLSASRSEGLPYAVCEAMANRVPAVLSDIPSVSWAHRSPGAVFFTPGAADELADAIRRVLQWSPAERAEYTAANDHLVRAEFDVAEWAERIAKIYEDILP